MGYGKYGHTPDFEQMDYEQLESYAIACQYEITHERNENAKLRELVAAMWNEMHADPYTIEQVTESFDRREWIKSRVQELGIEVGK